MFYERRSFAADLNDFNTNSHIETAFFCVNKSRLFKNFFFLPFVVSDVLRAGIMSRKFRLRLVNLCFFVCYLYECTIKKLLVNCWFHLRSLVGLHIKLGNRGRVFRVVEQARGTNLLGKNTVALKPRIENLLLKRRMCHTQV